MDKFHYQCLSSYFYEMVSIQKIKKLDVVAMNQDLLATLQLPDFAEYFDKYLKSLFDNAGAEKKYLAMAYAGHQFGHFNKLGDGRACLVGEFQNNQGKLVDLHLKGSGKTPYSRSGDGNAVLKPMGREFLISEAICSLGIPTTRSLALIKTGNKVFREGYQAGAMLVRCASSHLRVGTFEYGRAFTSADELKNLFEYAAKRHHPDVMQADNPALAFLESVLQKQLQLVNHWQRVGFIHGVMNTDNTTISGETIDYGPCAFMDDYHPQTVFSSIDVHGRYAFSNQPGIILWNLSRLAETLLELVDANEDKALSKVQAVLEKGAENYHQQYWQMMAQKIGFAALDDEIKSLTKSLLNIMQDKQLDYTNTFIDLENALIKPATSTDEPLSHWLIDWHAQIEKREGKKSAIALMKQNNPRVIPRNHLVEKALSALSNQDDGLFKQLYERYKNPYQSLKNDAFFQTPPKDNEKVMATFCGT